MSFWQWVCVCGRPKAGNTFDALDKWLLKNAWNTRSKRRRKKTCLAPAHQLFASHAHSRQMRTTWRRLLQGLKPVYPAQPSGYKRLVTFDIFNKKNCYSQHQLIFFKYELSVKTFAGYFTVYSQSPSKNVANINTRTHKVAHNKLALMHMEMHCLICIFLETKLQTTLLYFCLFAQKC